MFNFRKKVLNPLINEMASKAEAAHKVDEIAGRIEALLSLKEDSLHALVREHLELDAFAGPAAYLLPL